MDIVAEPRKTVEITERQALFIEQLCDGAWKTGGVRSPKDAETLEALRAELRKAFAK
jgi:hypothetical protein